MSDTTPASDVHARELAAQQRAWMKALLRPQAPLPWSDWRGGRRDHACAGAVYINNIRANVISALSMSYPATRHCMGDRRFGQLVLEGLAEQPPSSGDLAQYGEWLPMALSKSLARNGLREGTAAAGPKDERASDLVWLARLEWSLDQGRETESGAPWTWSQAARDMQQPRWLQARTRLRRPWQTWQLTAQRLALLNSVAPLLQADILPMQAFGQQAQSPDDASIRDEPEAMLQQGSRLSLIGAADQLWLGALDAGADIESATAQTVEVWPSWSPQTVLRHCLTHGLLSPLRFDFNPVHCDLTP